MTDTVIDEGIVEKIEWRAGKKRYSTREEAIERGIHRERSFMLGNKRFNTIEEAREHQETFLLDQFLGPLFRNAVSPYYNPSLSTLELGRNAKNCIGQLKTFLEFKLAKMGMDVPSDGLVNLDLSNDKRVDSKIATEMFLEAVWRVMINQKSISCNSLKKKILADPDLFMMGVNDLVEIYAWQKLEE